MATDINLPFVRTLLSNGYTDSVAAFTSHIQHSEGAVKRFQNLLEEIDDQGFSWDGPPTLDSFLGRVEESDVSLAQFLATASRARPTYVVFTNHGRDGVTVETGWQDSRSERVVWDRWTADVPDVVFAYAEACAMFDASDYKCAPLPVEKAAPPLYRYHPERFRATRDYAEPVGKLYRQQVEPESGVLTEEQLNRIFGMLISELNRRALDYPRRLKDDHPHPSLAIDAELNLATAYGRFVQAGRQVLDFPLELMELLAHTDADDIPLDRIRLPYAAQYLHFGPQSDLELEPGWLVDGAYVEQRGESGDIRFTITAVPTDRASKPAWFLSPEPQYTQDFVQNFRSMDLGTAVDMVVAETLAGLRAQQEEQGGDITEKAKDILAEKEMQLPDDVRIVDVSPELAHTRQDQVRRRHAAYKSALQRVVNALCYIAAYPDDIDPVWPDGTPASLVEKARTGKGKEVQRAQSKLLSLGYVPVHICGKRVGMQRARLGLDTRDGHIAAHWRRGHWRNQAHGPAHSLRKLIWILPLLVGAVRETAPDTGHIYLVDMDGGAA